MLQYCLISDIQYFFFFFLKKASWPETTWKTEDAW